MSWLFTSGGQNIGASASVNIQCWFQAILTLKMEMEIQRGWCWARAQSGWPRMGPSTLSVTCASVRGALRPQASPFLQNPPTFLDWVPSQAFSNSGCEALPVLSSVCNCSPHPIEMFRVLSNFTTPHPPNSVSFSEDRVSFFGSQATYLADMQGCSEHWEKQGPTPCYIFIPLYQQEPKKTINWKVRTGSARFRKEPKKSGSALLPAFDLHRSLPFGVPAFSSQKVRAKKIFFQIPSDYKRLPFYGNGRL